MSSFQPSILTSERLFPNTETGSERIAALSLLDAITVNFLDTCAVWLFDRPELQTQFDFVDHLRQSLRATLDAYPQWCGLVKAINTVNGPLAAGEDQLAPHARRFGRVYIHYGTRSDPGVEFIAARSTATLDELHPSSRRTSQPLWDQEKVNLSQFVPTTRLANPANVSDANILPPIMAIQVTELACGGFALAVKIAHTLADASAMIYFVKNWASVNRSLLLGVATPALNPVFEPERLDNAAAGDINAALPDESILQQAETLPFHRYDWWNVPADSPRKKQIPEAFRTKELSPAGKQIPWPEWDLKAPVSHYIMHLSRNQVEAIWKQASNASSADAKDSRLSRHDAVLAHIWASINRARNMHNDPGPVHCDLTYGCRPAFQLGDAFMGSLAVMVNVEMAGADVTTTAKSDGKETAVLPPIAQRIRQTLSRVRDPALLAAHLHSLAYETSPQRIWQGFLGTRHVMTTTWARAGLYEVDFGLGPHPTARYADGILANLDGLVLIKEAPPGRTSDVNGDAPPTWTDHGVDVQLHLRTEDMERLLLDPLLLPNEQ
ncbi:transferase family protein [Aspergillus sclerotiicarbonarius CBS 121057]|uniref:Transferase family protein n=1 Tax=Aspergillus sclerotiicarbonarius (strain CBS 121057 / IBT 28362) TaxID=1448318 RepID=A0A319ELE3_ASPSB|nr:transferase family protein [Aspergillus sclerotiicarbonarius CBS 121057]